MDWSSIGSFLNHGVHHVLEGWDHLLFAAALVHLRCNLRKTWDRNSRLMLVFGAMLLQMLVFLVPCLYFRGGTEFDAALRVLLAPAALGPGR